MLGIAETIMFYLLIGVGIGAAVFLSGDELSVIDRLFRVATAVVFWPVYLPALLQRPAGGGRRERSAVGDVDESASPRDDMDAAIAQVERELDAALDSLGGWAEGVLAREKVRFSELRSTWRAQADRIRELDTLLNQPEFVADPSTRENETADQLSVRDDGRLRRTDESRRENIARLRGIRQQMYDDLMGTLAWVRELVTMIHLAKFTGAPASRAEDLVAQIAAAVQGLTEVAEWDEDAALETV